jgi:nicotinate-nucleotide adenylyltransferase
LRKIGIYGGTFDPIHHGHLILAREALETLGLEKVIFVPASVSPLKEPPAANTNIRLSMLQAAIEGETGFTIDDCELLRPPPSYAIDTVQEIRKRESDAEMVYLIGDDNIATLPRWHRVTELEKLVRFVVLERTGLEIKHGYEVVRRRIDISATDIRNRVASGQSIRYLVPAMVEEIIRRENLYRENQR